MGLALISTSQAQLCLRWAISPKHTRDVCDSATFGNSTVYGRQRPSGVKKHFLGLKNRANYEFSTKKHQKRVIKAVLWNFEKGTFFLKFPILEPSGKVQL